MTKIRIISILIAVLSVNLFCQGGLPGFIARTMTQEEESLQRLLKTAKQNGDINKEEEIQNKLDLLTGSVTKKEAGDFGNFRFINSPLPTGDNINIVQLSQLRGVQALATGTEQRGQNIGRLWVAAAVSNTPDNDTLYYFYSDDAGVSWILYTMYLFAPSVQVSYDQMDFEIIEDNTGDKYLWTVYGLINSFGKKFCGGNVIKTPNFQGGAFVFMWPAENLSNTNFGRFRPRITTDNPKYSNTAAIYLGLSVDSLSSNYVGYFNFATCLNPYTTSPVITYFRSAHGLIIGDPNPTDLHLDIAYFYNGSDSLMIVSSNSYAVQSYLGFIKMGTNFIYNLNQPGLPNLSNYNKQYSRIVCSGGANQLTAMVVYRENYQNSGDWDLRGYKTTNAGRNWVEFNLDIRRDNVMIPYPADICAVRNRNGRFAISYTISGPANYDTVKYVFTDGVLPGFSYRTINHLSGFQRPKPGFRLVNNDSCFAVWSQKGSGNGDNIWVVSGCNGPISIGIHQLGSQVPAYFSLEQNYPNPFNPSTNFEFRIPVSGYVQLTVFNTLAEEQAVIVNETLLPGVYKVDFDASSLPSGVYFYRLIVKQAGSLSGDFSETRKMVLIK